MWLTILWMEHWSLRSQQLVVQERGNPVACLFCILIVRNVSNLSLWHFLLTTFRSWQIKELKHFETFLCSWQNNHFIAAIKALQLRNFTANVSHQMIHTVLGASLEDTTISLAWCRSGATAESTTTLKSLSTTWQARSLTTCGLKTSSCLTPERVVIVILSIQSTIHILEHKEYSMQC